MKRIVIAGVIVFLVGAGAFTAVQRSRMKHPHSGVEITIPGRDGAGVLLPDGWRVTPAGRQLATGDMILSAAISPDGKTLAFTNSGYTRHQLHVVDLATEKEIATFPLERAWEGLAWSPNGKKLLISAGQGNPSADIHTFNRWDDGTVSQGREVQLGAGAVKAKVAVSGIAVSPDGAAVYAVNDLDGFLYVLDGRTGETVSRVNLGDHPFAAKLSRDGKRLYVTLIGAAQVVAVDVADAAQPKIVERLDAEPHPNDLVITADDRLFVSCGNTNHVIAIDLKTKAKMEAINVAPSPKAPVGSTPNSVALSPDGHELYVADADNNSVAVVSIATRGQSKVSGFIPTGWYPTVVTATPDGKHILIGSGKGLGTGPNHVSRPINPDSAAGSFVHHGNNLAGLLSFVDTPNRAKLSEYTKQVIENSPYRDELLVKTDFKGDSVIPTEAGKRSAIEHVLYIIKENRTYDQVLGDIPKGNGDPSLVLFGRNVTPNHHAIAEQFVLLDNLYCNGEVSQDGHPWSTAAYASDFNQRAWTLSYSKHGNVNRGAEPPLHLVTRQGKGPLDILLLLHRPPGPERHPQRDLRKERSARPAVPHARLSPRRSVRRGVSADGRGKPRSQFHDHGPGRGPYAGHDARRVYAQGSGGVQRRCDRQDRRNRGQKQGVGQERHLHHRGRRAERAGPYRLPPHRRPGDQPVCEARLRR